MKKIYLAVALFSSMFFTMSCTNDESTEQLGNAAQVSFTIDVENRMNVRAISDGAGVNQLMYAIFNEDGTEVISKKAVVDIDNLVNGYTLTLPLAKGNTYTAVFWAQNDECDAYTVSDDMQVTVDYAGLNNDESRDAFFAATKPFKVVNHTSKAVILKRPFAQVNVGASEAETEAAAGLDILVTRSSATIKGVANKLNLVDGTVEGAVDVTYEAAAIPTDVLYVDSDNDDVKEAYDYVSMCYILADAEGTSHEMAFNFSADNGKFVEFVNGLTYVPVQRNWRTNIVGQVYTASLDFKIKIDTKYEDEMKVVATDKGVYYNVGEPMTVSNTTYILDNIDEGATFASQNAELITLNNVKFYGKVWTVVLGEYRGPKYRYYNNELNNVVCKDLVVSNVIRTHGVYVSVGTCVYGTSTINNCVMTGTTTVADTYFDGSKHDFTPVDIGIPNECDAVINGGKYDTMFFWEHAVATLNNVKADRIMSLTCTSTNHSMLTIAAGTEVGVLDCLQPMPYGSRLAIQEGAHVGVLNLASTSFESVTIAPGTVDKITCNGVEYTLDELLAMQ